MSKYKATIVIPSIREDSIKMFLSAWKELFKGHRVIVVEDNPTKSFKLPKRVEHYSWEEIDKELGDDAWVISRRSAAIRNFGYLKALEKPCDFIWTIDDDCMPIAGTSPIQEHGDVLMGKHRVTRWISSDKDGRMMRGIPYKNLTSEVEVVVSHGVWEGVPDLDAIHQLVGAKEFEPRVGVLPKDMYMPISGMNLAFRPEYTVLMYQFLAGKDQPFNRYEDIWMGVVAKRVLDHMDKYIYTGKAPVMHTRASDSITNLEHEVGGFRANERFWSEVEKHEDETYLEIATRIGELEDDTDYWPRQSEAMVRWNELVEERNGGD